MAIFKKNEPPAARASAARSAAGENAISIIGPGMRVEGSLSTDGTIRIEGSVQGTVSAGKAVVLGRNGEVVGDIFTEDAVIGGRVHGTLTARSRLELQSSCVVDGEIRTRAEHLQLDEGARFNGRIEMIEEGEALSSAASAGPEPAQLPPPEPEDIPTGA